MNSLQFDEILERRIDLTRKVLASKKDEYSPNEATLGYDRLHNFNRAVKFLNVTRQKALLGMMVKHLVSVVDIVDQFEWSALPSEAMIDEKIGDSINYLILLEAMLKEDRTNALGKITPPKSGAEEKFTPEDTSWILPSAPPPRPKAHWCFGCKYYDSLRTNRCVQLKIPDKLPDGTLRCSWRDPQRTKPAQPNAMSMHLKTLNKDSALDGPFVALICIGCANYNESRGVWKCSQLKTPFIPGDGSAPSCEWARTTASTPPHQQSEPPRSSLE